MPLRMKPLVNLNAVGLMKMEFTVDRLSSHDARAIRGRVRDQTWSLYIGTPMHSWLEG